MTAHDDNEQQKRAGRRRILDEVNQRLREALVAHSVTDDESELAMVNDDLDTEQQRLDQVAHNDPLGVAWFGNDDSWIDKRLSDA